MPRSVAYFWLLFVFLLVLQPVIGRVVRSRQDMMLVGFGPAVAFGTAHALGSVSQGSFSQGLLSPHVLPTQTGGLSRWVLWMAETGTVHLLTVMLAFAVIAYVAPFTTGVYQWWEADDLKFFILRAVLALLILVPALSYCRLLVVESLNASGGSYWHALTWGVAVLSETGTVVRRMLVEAAL